MEDYINVVKVRTHELKAKIFNLKALEAKGHKRSRELLIKGLESNLEAAQDMLFHLDQPKGKIH